LLLSPNMVHAYQFHFRSSLLSQQENLFLIINFSDKNN